MKIIRTLIHRCSRCNCALMYKDVTYIQIHWSTREVLCDLCASSDSTVK